MPKSEWTRAEVILASVGVLLTLTQVGIAYFEWRTSEDMADLTRAALAVEEARNTAVFNITDADLVGNASEPRIVFSVANQGLVSTEVSRVHVHWYFPEWTDGSPLGIGETEFPRVEDAQTGWEVAPGTERIFSVRAARHWSFDAVKHAQLDLTVHPVSGAADSYRWDFERFEIKKCGYWRGLGREANLTVNATGSYECEGSS